MADNDTAELPEGTDKIIQGAAGMKDARAVSRQVLSIWGTR